MKLKELLKNHDYLFETGNCSNENASDQPEVSNLVANQNSHKGTKREFKETLTEYKATKVQLSKNLQHQFALFILEKKFKDMRLNTGYGKIYKCNLLFLKERPLFVKIGKDRKELCKYVKFKPRDYIIFNFISQDEQYAHVNKNVEH